MFLLKYILFHAMKQIANACYFYYYAAQLPPFQLRLCQYFYEKKSLLFMYLFLFYDYLSQTEVNLRRTHAKLKNWTNKT